MIAAKQGNYSLSYTIYTNLLHDSRYDCQLKSEILASRATTLLLEEKCFESIDDCTQAIAYNQWNKLAYVVRAACWMIKQEYGKAVEDYSKLFHFFDQSEHVLELLNLAYEKLKASNEESEDEATNDLVHEDRNEISIPAVVPTSVSNSIPPISLASPTASFNQPAIYLCYPYLPYPTGHTVNEEPLSQASFMGTSITSPSFNYASLSTSSCELQFYIAAFVHCRSILFASFTTANIDFVSTAYRRSTKISNRFQPAMHSSRRSLAYYRRSIVIPFDVD